jgi:hypothetical protein
MCLLGGVSPGWRADGRELLMSGPHHSRGVRFIAETRGGVAGYRVEAEGTLQPLLSGVVQSVASLKPASWNQIASWLQQVEGFRRMA